MVEQGKAGDYRIELGVCTLSILPYYCSTTVPYIQYYSIVLYNCPLVQHTQRRGVDPSCCFGVEE